MIVTGTLYITDIGTQFSKYLNLTFYNLICDVVTILAQLFRINNNIHPLAC